MSDQSLLDSTRIFAARELAPQATEIDRTGELPAGRWASLGEFGLAGLAQARLIGGALAATETGGGSNAASIRTFARREGDEYVLDGGKFFISQAGAGDVYLVMARTDRIPARTH